MHQAGSSILDHVIRNGIRNFFTVARSIFNHLLNNGIIGTINDCPSRWNLINIQLKLFYIFPESRKHVDVVPCNPAEQSDVSMVEMKLRSAVNRRRKVFISLKYDDR